VRRFETHFRQVFHTFDSTATAAQRAESASVRCVHAWALLQCIDRLCSVVGCDTLLSLLPGSVWVLVVEAVELTKSGVQSVMSRMSTQSVESTSTTTTPNITLPVRRSDLQANIAAIYTHYNTTHNTSTSYTTSSTTYQISAHDHLITSYVLAWLRVVALPLTSAQLDGATITTHTNSNTNSSTNTSSTAAGNKRARTNPSRDADSFDFFAENDSDDDNATANNNNTSTRKRLRKSNGTYPRSQSMEEMRVDSVSSNSGSGNSCARKPQRLFALFERQRQFLVDNELQGVAVMVLVNHHLAPLCSAHTLLPTLPSGSSTDNITRTSTSTTPTTSNINTIDVLVSAVDSVVALLEHSSAVSSVSVNTSTTSGGDVFLTETLEAALVQLQGTVLRLYTINCTVGNLLQLTAHIHL